MSLNSNPQCTHTPGLFPGYAAQATQGMTGNAADFPWLCMTYDYSATVVFIIVSIGVLIYGVVSAREAWDRHLKKAKEAQ